MINKESTKKINRDFDFEIQLHSHATLEFKYNDFSLLCDPWIEGKAFLGAWDRYPKPVIKTEDLNPDAIWISHEHSDHFHEATLKKLNKNVPVYIPAFLNERLEVKLSKLGFENIVVVPFGEKLEISSGFNITTYEPASLWNDAQVLIEINDFKILNINDAGINHRTAKKIGHVDLIAAAFSPGASGYPITWENISREKKIEILKKSKVATLEMLNNVTKIYNATYFVPFASHFVLGHKAHSEYMEIIQKNTVDDVVKYFQDKKSKCEVIDLLAGDYWNFNSKKIVKINRDREKLFQLDTVMQYVEENDNIEEFNTYYPSKNEYLYDKKIVYSYFGKLNLIPEMAFCEDITVNIYPNNLLENAFSFEIKQGYLTILNQVLKNSNLTINIPNEILMYICINNEAWDEATIGYWCTFNRNPDIYHSEFWRILQTPFYLKNPRINLNKNDNKFINEESNLAFIIENLGERGRKILGRYGL